MPFKPDILEQVESLLRKHNRDEPDPEKKENPEASAFMSGFREIEAFVVANGRLPEKGKSISERTLPKLAFPLSLADSVRHGIENQC